MREVVTGRAGAGTVTNARASSIFLTASMYLVSGIPVASCGLAKPEYERAWPGRGKGRVHREHGCEAACAGRMDRIDPAKREGARGRGLRGAATFRLHLGQRVCGSVIGHRSLSLHHGQPAWLDKDYKRHRRRRQRAPVADPEIDAANGLAHAAQEEHSRGGHSPSRHPFVKET